jgi:hypothetical protein
LAIIVKVVLNLDEANEQLDKFQASAAEAFKKAGASLGDNFNAGAQEGLDKATEQFGGFASGVEKQLKRAADAAENISNKLSLQDKIGIFGDAKDVFEKAAGSLLGFNQAAIDSAVRIADVAEKGANIGAVFGPLPALILGGVGALLEYFGESKRISAESEAAAVRHKQAIEGLHLELKALQRDAISDGKANLEAMGVALVKLGDKIRDQNKGTREGSQEGIAKDTLFALDQAQKQVQEIQDSIVETQDSFKPKSLDELKTAAENSAKGLTTAQTELGKLNKELEESKRLVSSTDITTFSGLVQFVGKDLGGLVLDFSEKIQQQERSVSDARAKASKDEAAYKAELKKSEAELERGRQESARKAKERAEQSRRDREAEVAYNRALRESILALREAEQARTQAIYDQGVELQKLGEDFAKVVKGQVEELAQFGPEIMQKFLPALLDASNQGEEAMARVVFQAKLYKIEMEGLPPLASVIGGQTGQVDNLKASIAGLFNVIYTEGSNADIALTAISGSLKDIGSSAAGAIGGAASGALSDLFEAMAAGEKTAEGFAKSFARKSAEALRSTGSDLIGDGIANELKALAMTFIPGMQGNAVGLASAGAAEIAAGLAMGGVGVGVGRRVGPAPESEDAARGGSSSLGGGGGPSLGAATPRELERAPVIYQFFAGGAPGSTTVNAGDGPASLAQANRELTRIQSEGGRVGSGGFTRRKS